MSSTEKISYHTADHEFLYHPLDAHVEIIFDGEPNMIIDEGERLPFESIEEFAARWLEECE